MRITTVLFAAGLFGILPKEDRNEQQVNDKKE